MVGGRKGGKPPSTTTSTRTQAPHPHLLTRFAVPCGCPCLSLYLYRWPVFVAADRDSSSGLRYCRYYPPPILGFKRTTGAVPVKNKSSAACDKQYPSPSTQCMLSRICAMYREHEGAHMHSVTGRVAEGEARAGGKTNEEGGRHTCWRVFGGCGSLS
jgi:hypothetical protein